ncbi:uncharacterized protein RJT20DRAFT_28627 [Scheffersomyces xylosifermentans]|uniref:uncharacterized protein n=1 Tax=Scheffersomyces xylosifermentans TaxID=1304137 RepID=UPI00315D52CC
MRSRSNSAGVRIKDTHEANDTSIDKIEDSSGKTTESSSTLATTNKLLSDLERKLSFMSSTSSNQTQQSQSSSVIVNKSFSGLGKESVQSTVLQYIKSEEDRQRDTHNNIFNPNELFADRQAKFLTKFDKSYNDDKNKKKTVGTKPENKALPQPERKTSTIKKAARNLLTRKNSLSINDSDQFSQPKAPVSSEDRGTDDGDLNNSTDQFEDAASSPNIADISFEAVEVDDPVGMEESDTSDQSIRVVRKPDRSKDLPPIPIDDEVVSIVEEDRLSTDDVKTENNGSSASKETTKELTSKDKKSKIANKASNSDEEEGVYGIFFNDNAYDDEYDIDNDNVDNDYDGSDELLLPPSPPRSPPRDLDPDKLYGLYDFSGPDPSHCSLSRDEPVYLINDQDNYWWLIRKMTKEERMMNVRQRRKSNKGSISPGSRKRASNDSGSDTDDYYDEDYSDEEDGKIGFVPAECLETYGERLARLNCFKNEELEKTSRDSLVETNDETRHIGEAEHGDSQSLQSVDSIPNKSANTSSILLRGNSLSKSNSLLKRSGSKKTNNKSVTFDNLSDLQLNEEDGDDKEVTNDEDLIREQKKKAGFDINSYYDIPHEEIEKQKNPEQDDEKGSEILSDVYPSETPLVITKNNKKSANQKKYTLLPSSLIKEGGISLNPEDSVKSPLDIFAKPTAVSSANYDQVSIGSFSPDTPPGGFVAQNGRSNHQLDSPSLDDESGNEEREFVSPSVMLRRSVILDRLTQVTSDIQEQLEIDDYDDDDDDLEEVMELKRSLQISERSAPVKQVTVESDDEYDDIAEISQQSIEEKHRGIVVIDSDEEDDLPEPDIVNLEGHVSPSKAKKKEAQKDDRSTNKDQSTKPLFSMPSASYLSQDTSLSPITEVASENSFDRVQDGAIELQEEDSKSTLIAAPEKVIESTPVKLQQNDSKQLGGYYKPIESTPIKLAQGFSNRSSALTDDKSIEATPVRMLREVSTPTAASYTPHQATPIKVQDKNKHTLVSPKSPDATPVKVSQVIPTSVPGGFISTDVTPVKESKETVKVPGQFIASDIAPGGKVNQADIPKEPVSKSIEASPVKQTQDSNADIVTSSNSATASPVKIQHSTKKDSALPANKSPVKVEKEAIQKTPIKAHEDDDTQSHVGSFSSKDSLATITPGHNNTTTDSDSRNQTFSSPLRSPLSREVTPSNIQSPVLRKKNSILPVQREEEEDDDVFDDDEDVLHNGYPADITPLTSMNSLNYGSSSTPTPSKFTPPSTSTDVSDKRKSRPVHEMFMPILGKFDELAEKLAELDGML